MRRNLFRSMIVIVVTALAACAGSTSFLVDSSIEMTLAPGVSDSVTLEFEAEGSHSGEYIFTATVTDGEGLSATVEPATAEVDGVVDVVVTVTASDGAAEGNGYVSVEGVSSSNDKNSAGTTVFVSVEP